VKFQVGSKDIALLFLVKEDEGGWSTPGLGRLNPWKETHYLF